MACVMGRCERCRELTVVRLMQSAEGVRRVCAPCEVLLAAHPVTRLRAEVRK